jgi:hypothetical protein
MAKHLRKENVGAQPPNEWHLTKLIDCDGTDSHLDYDSGVPCYQCGECIPCGSALPGCPHYPSDCCTPHVYNVGSSSHTGCACNDCGHESIKVDTLSVTAVYNLTQDPVDYCLWINSDVGTLSFSRYTANDCSGTANGSHTATLQAKLKKINQTDFTYTIWCTVPDFYADPPALITIEIFTQTINKTADVCNEDLSFTDNENDCACDDGPWGAFVQKLSEDGSHTISPCA